DADARVLRIAAARRTAEDREVVGCRCPPILGLEHREAILRPGGRHEQENTGENAEGADHRRCRVASEYSSIWAVRSQGYSIATSMIAPDSSTMGASLGMTKPV